MDDEKSMPLYRIAENEKEIKLSLFIAPFKDWAHVSWNDAKQKKIRLLG